MGASLDRHGGDGRRAAKPQPPLELHSGARVGLITVLDAEVTHFHAAAQVMASSLKTQPVPWRVDLILGQALAGAADWRSDWCRCRCRPGTP